MGHPNHRDGNVPMADSQPSEAMNPPISASQTSNIPGLGAGELRPVMGAVYSIRHGNPKFVNQEELIQVIDHNGTVQRGAWDTEARDWPRGSRVTLVAEPMEQAPRSMNGHECPTCGDWHYDGYEY